MEQVASLLGGLLCLGLFGAACGLWGWMLAEILLHEPNYGPAKPLWLYAVLVMFPLGGLVYLLFRRGQRRRLYGA